MSNMDPSFYEFEYDRKVTVYLVRGTRIIQTRVHERQAIFDEDKKGNTSLRRYYFVKLPHRNGQLSRQKISEDRLYPTEKDARLSTSITVEVVK